MKYRDLGRTGLRCSEISLGTWSFASQVYGDVDEAQAYAAVDEAIASGINVFDTAPLYGSPAVNGVAEEVLGRALGSRRDSILISTKFGRYSTDPSPNFHAGRARESVEASLARLDTDRIDILFFHSPFSEADIHDDVWAELDRLKREGKVRFIAHSLSMFQQTKGMALRWAREGLIDVVQMVYSLLNRETEEFIASMGALNVGIIARESLANGFLSGGITRDTVFAPNNLNSRYTSEEIAERVDQVERLSFLVRGEVGTMPQAALRWVLDNPAVSTVLSGARNGAEIRDCAAASDAAPYTQDELERARKMHAKDFPAA